MANTSRKRALRPRPSTQSPVVGDSGLQRDSPVTNLKSPLEILSTTSKTASETQKYKLLAWNLLLVGVQIYSAMSANSLSLFTAIIHSTINFLLIIAIMLRGSFTETSSRRVPVVTSRISTAGRILFAFTMITFSMVCAALSCQEILRGQRRVPSLPSITVMSGVFVGKLCVFFYSPLKPGYPQTRTWSKTHPNDLSIHGLGILMSISGLKTRWWWIDALGAIVLCVSISWTWGCTLVYELKLLIGVSADAETHDLIREIALAHDARVLNVNYVRAHHAGSGLVVEVDIVMSPCLTLKVSRDVAKGLQAKLERFLHVERAFVHVAYETRGDVLEN